MNIEGNTYLFFDKFCVNNSDTNIHTKNITFEMLYNSDYQVFNDENAIIEFNKSFNNTLNIYTNLDINFYNLSFFIIPESSILEPLVPEIKILCVCINHQKLYSQLGNDFNNDKIPNIDFFKKACLKHFDYTVNKNNIDINELIKIKASQSNTDLTDPIIEDPSFIKLKLFDYQKKTIKWLTDKEKNINTINYSTTRNNIIYFGDLIYQIFYLGGTFILKNSLEKIEFKGGLLADEMGLGKTLEIITMSLLNPAVDISYFQSKFELDESLLCSRATLILSPNHLSNQWIREFTKTVHDSYNLKVVSLLTKTHHDKITYLDILNADFVIVSYNFLGNDSYYKNWITSLSSLKKGSTYISSTIYSEEKVREKIAGITKSIKNDPSKLFDKNPLINCIKFNRIIIDEFHELLTVSKYNFILKLIKLFQSNYKWVVSGTPFDKSDYCLKEMIDFTTDYKITKSGVLEIDNVKNYILNDFFRKNTKVSVENENKLLPIVEEIIKLKFTPTERAMFNAYIANSNIDKRSILVRQLCCDPRIVNELKDELSGCKTPEDIQRTMVKHYKNEMDKASKKVRCIKYKIKKIERRIKIVEFRRYRKFLKQIGYHVTIEYPEKITDPEFDNKVLEDDDNTVLNENALISDSDYDDDDDNDENKPKIIVNNNTIQDIVKQIANKLNGNPSITLNEMKNNLELLIGKEIEANKQYEGKRSTSEFFSNMMNKINKIMDKKKEKDMKDDSDESESDEDEDEDEMCSICLNKITGEDIGVTKCGHMYCFQCIKDIVKSNPKCPLCMKPVQLKEISLISFEDLTAKTNTKDIRDKITLISKIGTKLANLIFYIKNCKEKCIVFSQWDSLLKKVGDVLDTYGVKNVFCRGNVWTRDKAIRDFTTKDNIQVIMLSSESAAAGTNLTTATKVILLEPVNGSYEYRKNTEGQAIGRAHRTGQTKQVTVVRFIIKDTVEEEIYNENIIEDAKFKSDIKMTLLTDDNLNLTKEEIDIIAQDEEINIKKKESKPKKKVVTKKKGNLLKVDSDIDSDVGVDSD